MRTALSNFLYGNDTKVILMTLKQKSFQFSSFLHFNIDKSMW